MRTPSKILWFVVLMGLGACTQADHLRTPYADATHASPAATSDKSELYKKLRVREDGDSVRSIPLSQSGVTLVNLFDEFCSDCATGMRLEMLDKLAKTHSGSALVVFSERTFSRQDIKNFEIMLNTTVPLYRGDLNFAKPIMIGGQLLFAFNTQGQLVWQQTPGMTEDEIASQAARLVGQ